MKKRLFSLTAACALLVATVGVGFAQTSNRGVHPSTTQLPVWLQQGRFRFARFDGGPIEVQKTRRSAWGMRFTPEEQKVLANLYGIHEYGPHMANLLVKAHVNFVWVTYSVGFSWEDESPQRALVREITRLLHERGIKVAAYMDAHSIFWQSMFRDVPQSVRWLMFDSKGLPYRYSGGRDALRYIANLDDPGWVRYEEKRVSGAIDDGMDAIFFDNTGNPDWSSNEAEAAFFTKIRRFIHNQKHSTIPTFSNFGLSPSRAALNRYMDFTFNESWVEPGVWGKEWQVSNIRRTRYMRGLLPPHKPFITEYSLFHGGNRSTEFLKAKSEALSIAEAAAFGSAYTWDMEGPFDAALINQDRKAMHSWSAISRYNGFLANHEAFYVGAENVTPLAVLLPDSFKPGFAWTSPDPLIDLLSRQSVLYAIKLAKDETAQGLRAYAGIIIPSYESLSSEEKKNVRDYAMGGGKVYAFGEMAGAHQGFTAFSDANILPKLGRDKAADEQVIAKVDRLAQGATQVRLATHSHVLANVTTLDHHQEVVLHLLNYDSKPTQDLEIQLTLGKEFGGVVGKSARLLSPDPHTTTLQNARWKGNTFAATLPSLQRYALIVLK